MSNKPKQYYLTDEQRRKKRKRHNLIIYMVSSVLILFGIYMIISDQTLFFKRIENKIVGTVEMPTLPPGPSYTIDPNMTQIPRDVDPSFTPFVPSEDDTETPQVFMPTLPPTAATTEPAVSTKRPQATGSASATPAVNSTPAPTPESTSIPNAYPYAPKYVHFVGHDISCPIDPVGLDSKGQMSVVRSAFRAGWYKDSGDSVNGGNIIIAGHNRYSSKLGYFSIIKDRMQVGDMVILEMNNGENAYYMVESIKQYPYDSVPDSVMMTGGKNRLTLITCLGDYSFLIHTSRHRVIAICVPVVFENSDREPPPAEAPIVK